MKINFNIDEKMEPNQIEIVINAAKLTPSVTNLLSVIKAATGEKDNILVKENDQTVIVALKDIIAIEIFSNQLVIHTSQGDFTTRGTLKEFSDKLSGSSFIQISRNTVINIEHLNSLSAEFSGNLTASMSNNLRLTASRRFVPALKHILGLEN